MARILITGGRGYRTRLNVFWTLAKIGVIDLLIFGDATGADEFAHEWARTTGTPFKRVKAPWKFMGLGAGHMRNGYMLDLNPDYVLAFPGDIGTRDCMKQARDRGITVFEVK